MPVFFKNTILLGNKTKRNVMSEMILPQGESAQSLVWPFLGFTSLP